MSVHKERQRMFAAELAQARTEREQFTTILVARFGKKAADAIRQEARRTEDMFVGRGETPRRSQEPSIAAKMLRMYDRKVMAVRKKIRAPECWFCESPGPVSVLDAAGLSWRMVNARCSNGHLPLSGVLWLLKALHTAEHEMPAEIQAWERAATGQDRCRLPEKWRRLLHHRRRRLARLLHAAAMREEDVRWKFRT
jgi:hypothetical protein